MGPATAAVQVCVFPSRRDAGAGHLAAVGSCYEAVAFCIPLMRHRFQPVLAAFSMDPALREGSAATLARFPRIGRRRLFGTACRKLYSASFLTSERCRPVPAHALSSRNGRRRGIHTPGAKRVVSGRHCLPAFKTTQASQAARTNAPSLFRAARKLHLSESGLRPASGAGLQCAARERQPLRRCPLCVGQWRASIPKRAFTQGLGTSATGHRYACNNVLTYIRCATYAPPGERGMPSAPRNRPVCRNMPGAPCRMCARSCILTTQAGRAPRRQLEGLCPGEERRVLRDARKPPSRPFCERHAGIRFPRPLPFQGFLYFRFRHSVGCLRYRRPRFPRHSLAERHACVPCPRRIQQRSVSNGNDDAGAVATAGRTGRRCSQRRPCREGCASIAPREPGQDAGRCAVAKRARVAAFHRTCPHFPGDILQFAMSWASARLRRAGCDKVRGLPPCSVPSDVRSRRRVCVCCNARYRRPFLFRGQWPSLQPGRQAATVNRHSMRRRRDQLRPRD